MEICNYLPFRPLDLTPIYPYGSLPSLNAERCESRLFGRIEGGFQPDE
jgi:hypothetical protein